MSERWRTVLAIDHDAKACEVYRANFAGGGLGACGWHGRAWRERGMA